MKKVCKGIICITISAMCFAFMNCFVRLSGDLPSIQKSFFRNFVAVLCAATVIFKNHINIKLKKSQFLPMFIRCAMGTAGILCNFYAVDHLVLSDASMLNKMSPFFAVIFSSLFLKEKISPVQILTIVLAGMGSLLIIKPSFSNMVLVPSLIGLAGGMCAGAAYTAVRKLGSMKVNGSVTVLMFSLFSCIVTIPYLIFNYSPMQPIQLMYLLLAGISAAGGQFAITYAYTFAPAKEISVYDYSQVIFSAVIGYFVFSQTPDILSFAGYGVICLAAIVSFFFNRKKHAEAA